MTSDRVPNSASQLPPGVGQSGQPQVQTEHDDLLAQQIDHTSPLENEEDMGIIWKTALYDCTCAVAALLFSELDPSFDRASPSLAAPMPCIEYSYLSSTEREIHVAYHYPPLHILGLLPRTAENTVREYWHVVHEIASSLAGYLSVMRAHLGSNGPRIVRDNTVEDILTAVELFRWPKLHRVNDLVTFFAPECHRCLLKLLWDITADLVEAEWHGIEAMTGKLVASRFIPGPVSAAEWRALRAATLALSPPEALKSEAEINWRKRFVLPGLTESQA